MNLTPLIQVRGNKYGSVDIIIFNCTKDLQKWFSMIDIWGNNGYDRYEDGSLYFDIPKEFYSLIAKLPFVKRYGIKVVYN